MLGMRFDKTLPGRDVCHQRYVRTTENGHYACACMRGMRFAESGRGRIWVHVPGASLGVLGAFYIVDIYSYNQGGRGLRTHYTTN